LIEPRNERFCGEEGLKKGVEVTCRTIVDEARVLTNFGFVSFARRTFGNCRAEVVDITTAAIVGFEVTGLVIEEAKKLRL